MFDRKSINLTLTKATGVWNSSRRVIAWKQSQGAAVMLAYLAQTSLRPCDVVRQMFAGPRRCTTSSHPFPRCKGEEHNWSRPPPGAHAGTYRLINKHCQRVLQVAAGDRRGCHGAGTARPLPYCKLLASLPRWAAGNGGAWTETKNHPRPHPTNKHTNPCTFPLGCHKTLQSFPQVASTAESCRTGKHIMSVFIRLFFFLFPLISGPLLEAGVAGMFVSVHAGMFVHIQRTLLTC